MEVTVSVTLEAVGKSARCHLEYNVFNRSEFVVDRWVIPVLHLDESKVLLQKATYGGRSESALNTSNASSSLPFQTSHRGDSGRRGMKMRMINARTIWKAMGNLQEISLGSAKDKPRSIQYEIMTPKTIIEPSIMTIWPRRCDLDVSDCHVGTVDVFIPADSQ